MVVEREVGFDLGGHLEVALVGVEVIKKLVQAGSAAVVIFTAEIEDGLFEVTGVLDVSCQAKKHSALSATRDVLPFLMK